MNIWLVTVGEPLPTDPGGSRLLRTGLLAGHLAARGHEVCWWSSTFDHVSKRHRAPADVDLTLENGVRVRLLHGCGYRRNVSLRRILDHVLVARRFARQAQALPSPDVMLCSLPTLELAVAATRHGHASGVPVALDIRDLWPDYLAESTPVWRRPLTKFLLAPMARQADIACRLADTLTGNAQAFVDWGLRRAGRAVSGSDRPFPHAYPVRPLDPERLAQASEFWRSWGIDDDGIFTVCYFGVFSCKCDLEGVIDAAANIERSGRKMRFVLCGAGDEEGALRRRAAGLATVIFPGWVGEAEIRVLMGLSHVGMAPYRNHVGFIGNLPNKLIEYLAGGLPIVTCLRGGEIDFLYREGCAALYPESDARALTVLLSDLVLQQEKQSRMAAAACRVFAAHYSEDVVYEAMADWLEALAAGGKVVRA